MKLLFVANFNNSKPLCVMKQLGSQFSKKKQAYIFENNNKSWSEQQENCKDLIFWFDRIHGQ